MHYIQRHQFTQTQSTLLESLGLLKLTTTSRESDIYKIHYFLLICILCLIHFPILRYAIVSNRYADRLNAYWTGYFTSRPGIKGYVRALSGYYLVTPCVCSLLVK